MQLNITTDYAIRMVLYLATVGRAAGSGEIASAMGIPRNMMATMSPKLRRAGIIQAVRGANGGYTLCRAPEDISLSQIVNAMEGTTRLNRCLEDDHFCSRGAAETCPVRKFYVGIQKLLDETFQEETIAKLM